MFPDKPSADQPTPTGYMPSDTNPPTATYQAGMTIGRYVIEQLIGRGGMANIYLARDPNTERQVAIKIMPYQFNYNEEFRARFQREARVIATLEHANIVPVYDFGEENAQLYIVMRYMAGGSLAQMLDGPMPMDETLAIVERLAEALDDVHAQGIIHRDLKPDNILFDYNGNAYLSDFGIVKLAQSNSLMTATGLSAGTPAYMSPEQIQAKIALDGRSDVYALTVIVYEMLAGEPPFMADTTMGLIAQHLFDPVPSIRAINPDFSQDVQLVIERGMAKDREDRYPTAAALLEDLENALAGRVIASETVDLAAARPTPTLLLPATQPEEKERRKVGGWIWLLGIGGLAAIVAVLIFLPGILGPRNSAGIPPTNTAITQEATPLPIVITKVQEVVITATSRPTGTPSVTPSLTLTRPPVQASNAAIPPSATAVPPSETPQPSGDTTGGGSGGGNTPSGGSSGGTDSGSSSSGGSATSGTTDSGSSSSGSGGLLDGGLLTGGILGGN